MQSSLRLLSTSISPQLVSVPFISSISSLNRGTSSSHKTFLASTNVNQHVFSPHTPISLATWSNGSWSSSSLSSKGKQYISTSVCRQSHVDFKVESTAWKSDTGTAWKGDTGADAKAIAKIEADIEECKSEIKDMKSQISQLKTDIAIKDSKLNDIETREEDKVDIRNEKAQLNDQLTQLETRLTNEKTHLIKLQEAALRLKEEDPEINERAAKIAAETEAIKAKSAADIAKIAEETHAIKAKSAEETAKSAEETASKKRIRWGFRFGLLLLVADYILNDFEPFLKWRMKWQLTHYPGQDPHKDQSTALPVPGEPFELECDKVNMLLAPTGTGKSTFLRKLAHDEKTKKPVCLINFRLTQDDSKNEKDIVEPSIAVDPTRMTKIAEGVFSQIGYPNRHSLIITLLQKGFTAQNINIPSVLPENIRLVNAFQLLFKVTEELYNESSLPDGLTKPIKPLLLFDEMHDLIKDKRLAAVGGRELFKALLERIVLNCVDKRNVNVVMAGSSNDLNNAFAKHFGTETRNEVYILQDPLLDTVEKALIAKHYTAEDVRKITNVCGTRLRILSKILNHEGNTLNIDYFLSKRISNARVALNRLLGEASSPHDANAIVQALDDIYDGKVVEIYRIPDSVLRCKSFSSVFYINDDNTLAFQNRPVEMFWKSGRNLPQYRSN